MNLWAGNDMGVVFDAGRICPVRPGETISASLWTKSDAAHDNCAVDIVWLDANGVEVGRVLSDGFPISDTWSLAGFTEEVAPVGAVGCRLKYWLAVPDTSVYIAAPQIEVGPNTDWQTGGDAPEVLLDQLSTTSPIFQLRDATLTLLEA
jgi:hypothetical protein